MRKRDKWNKMILVLKKDIAFVISFLQFYKECVTILYDILGVVCEHFFPEEKRSKKWKRQKEKKKNRFVLINI